MHRKIPIVYEKEYEDASVTKKQRSFSVFKICVTTGGNAVWKINNRQVLVSEGDVYFLSNSDMRCFSYIDGSIKMIICEIDPLYMDKMFLPLFKERPTEIPRSFNIKNVKRFEYYIKEALRENSEKKDYSEYCICQSVNLALTEALRHFSRGMKLKTREIKDEVLEVLDYIDLHLAENFTLEQLAKEKNMSSSAMCKQFSKSVGVGFSKYVAQKRVEYVIDMIKKNKNMNILDAAFASGFKNSAAFYDTFKKMTGTTPKEIRKNRYYPL